MTGNDINKVATPRAMMTGVHYTHEIWQTALAAEQWFVWESRHVLRLGVHSPHLLLGNLQKHQHVAQPGACSPPNLEPGIEKLKP